MTVTTNGPLHIGPLMRSTITLAMALCLVSVSAQEEVTGAQVASVLPQDPGKTPSTRWSGSGRNFRAGQPIEPIALRAVTWEFGDGSLSRILPPRSWRASDKVDTRVVPMAPFRERNGGSPCVAVAHEWRNDEDAPEPRPQVVIESGVPVLVTTGSGDRHLVVRMQDPVSGQGTVVERGFASGRWAFGTADEPGRPLFITLQDLATGERWRAGVNL